MSVKLVSITESPESLILYCARVSSDQSNEKTGLLKYLIEHKHWSPFEMAHAVFEINTSRAIAAQILRHRSFSFQEFSQRYAEPSGFLNYKGRRQAESNRQSSIDDLDEETLYWFRDAQDAAALGAFKLYNEAIERGIAKEAARFLLPLSTKTKLYMAGTIRSWIHYFDLRCDEHTQLEHRVLALSMREILTKHLPHTAEALGWIDDTV